MSQSRLLPSWLPLARCTAATQFGEQGLCPQPTTFDSREFCYLHAKVAAGLFNGWRSRPLFPRGGRPDIQRYDYDAWFDGEPHTLIQGVDFAPGVASMATSIRRQAQRRGVEIVLQRRGPRSGGGTIHVQAIGKQGAAA